MSKFTQSRSLAAFKKERGISSLDLFKSKDGNSEYFVYYEDSEGNRQYGYVSSKLDTSKPMMISVVITDDDEEIPVLHNAPEMPEPSRSL